MEHLVTYKINVFCKLSIELRNLKIYFVNNNNVGYFRLIIIKRTMEANYINKISIIFTKMGTFFKKIIQLNKSYS